MALISIEFFVFFAVCFLLYYTVPPKFQKAVLLLGSCIFIGYYHISFLFVALLISLFTFYCGKIISKTGQDKKRGRYYFSILFLIVIVWLVLRYPEGLVHFLNALFISGGSAVRLGPHSILFPLGISFYTFQAISYLTDLYWEESEPEDNIFNFMIYMLFFMKFLSGPIERSSGLLAQLKENKKFDYDSVSYGLKLVALGLVKKLIISDNMAPYIDGMYASLHDLSGVQLVVTCLLYPIQLYADFSGYTDMALGGALMFGFRLVQNFDRPFISKNTSELWRRWHMSLSFWVRDYVYIPLSSLTRNYGKWGVSLSLLLTFTVLGIWHGAGWNFVVYGLIQGIIITYEMNTVAFHEKLSDKLGKPLYSIFSIIRTYLLFALSLVFFRADSFKDAVYFIGHLSFNMHDSWKELNIGMPDHICIVTGVTLLLMLIYEHYHAKSDLILSLNKKPAAVRWLVYYALLFAILSLGGFNTDTFVYVQF